MIRAIRGHKRDLPVQFMADVDTAIEHLNQHTKATMSVRVMPHYAPHNGKYAGMLWSFPRPHGGELTYQVDDPHYFASAANVTGILLAVADDEPPAADASDSR